MGTPTPADVAPRPALRASRLEAWDHCPRADRVEDVGSPGPWPTRGPGSWARAPTA